MTARHLRVLNLATTLTRYADGLKLQDSIAAQRKLNEVADTLILLQHFPTYTLGKRGAQSDFRVPQQVLEAQGIDICAVPRGGEVTFHGPGQLVAYPIVDIRAAGLGARAYVESLEDVLVSCLSTYGISARGRVPGATGVWVGERKIAAIGVKISHGVSSHGIALNVSTDLSYFANIVPCGIPDKEVTSILHQLAGGLEGSGAGGGPGTSRSSSGTSSSSSSRSSNDSGAPAASSSPGSNDRSSSGDGAATGSAGSAGSSGGGGVPARAAGAVMPAFEDVAAAYVRAFTERLRYSGATAVGS